MCRYHKRNAMKKQTETVSDFSLLCSAIMDWLNMECEFMNGHQDFALRK